MVKRRLRQLRLAATLAVLALLAAACGSDGSGDAAAPRASAVEMTAELKALVAEAKAQGGFVWGTAPSDNPMIAKLPALIEQLYGVKLNVRADTTSNYPQMLAKVTQESKAGSTPSYDLTTWNAGVTASGVNAGVVEKIDWKRYKPDLPADALRVDGNLLETTSRLLLPAYNTSGVSKDQAPKSHEDLLDPRLKGKLSIQLGAQTLAYFAHEKLMGPQKTVEFITKLASQKPYAGRFPDIMTRLVSGEYPYAFEMVANVLAQEQDKGAPVAFAPVKDYLRVSSFGQAVMKNAKNRAAATLAALALTTPEGQALLKQTLGVDAAWSKDSVSGKAVKEFPGKVWIDAEYPDFLLSKELADMSTKLAKILGQ